MAVYVFLHKVWPIQQSTQVDEDDAFGTFEEHAVVTVVEEAPAKLSTHSGSEKF